MDAIRRFESIRLKNSACFDKYYGGVTLALFPINIVMLPFLLPISLFKNPRISEFVLKMQYWIMMIFYGLISLALSPLLVAFLYIKLILNSTFILFYNHK